MSKKLYVGNLPYSVTTDQLRDHFAQAGTVTDSVVISDSRTGRSKGFGFVEFEKDDDATKAISMFGGKDFQGRDLVVNEARPKVEDGGPSSRTAPVSAPEPKVSEEPVEEVKEEKSEE